MLCSTDRLAVAVVGGQVEVGNSAALSPFAKREVMPGNLKGAELERFVRDAVMTYWHQTGTAKMGQDAMSVVDGTLKVYGTEHLRVADGSIMPRVTTGNTMAPASSSANAPRKSFRPSTRSEIAQEGILLRAQRPAGVSAGDLS
jgi:choline dehydrogenase-like flavoprotein